jgi:hypothetical protein
MNSAVALLIESAKGVAGSTESSLLPSLIVPLFSGFVGGLIVMLIQNHLKNKEEERNRQQELKGLIRLVDAEMSRNEDLLKQALAVDVATSSGAGRSPILALNGLEGADWDRTKVRLARLADGEYFNKLDAYYIKARDLAQYAQRLRDQATVNQSQLMEVQNVAEKVKAASDEARQESSKRLQT